MKHLEFHFQNKFEKLVNLVGFIIRKFITMHGRVNVKDHYSPHSRQLVNIVLNQLNQI
jgi:hypothetical protein